MQYIKKTSERSVKEKEYFDSFISKLDKFKIKVLSVENLEISIKFEFSMNFTMIDGKVANAVLNVKSSESCAVCKATHTMMND